MNKITIAIKDNKNMFKNISYLEKVNCNFMLQSNYSNEDINKTFDLWNKKYGNNIHFNDNDDTDRNNLGEVAKEVLADLVAIEPDEDKILDSLVLFLYGKPSTRKKKLLWYIFGKKLFERIQDHLGDIGYCTKCGRRSGKLINGWCEPCTMSDNVKPIVCVDCGKEFYVANKKQRICRCDDCQREYRKMWDRQRKKQNSTLQNPS